MYIAELQEMIDAEKQLSEALLCMASVASHEERQADIVLTRLAKHVVNRDAVSA